MGRAAAVIWKPLSAHSSLDRGRTPDEEAAEPVSHSDLEETLEALHPASFGWALGCCGWDRGEAEEVLQTTYLKVLDGKARFEGRSSLKTWLFTVIRRTAAQRRRQRWIRSLALGRWDRSQPGAVPAPTPESILAESETSRALRRALQALPARQRDLLHLVFYEELTVEEAAAVLGISVGTARTHYHRGKERLREKLAPGSTA